MKKRGRPLLYQTEEERKAAIRRTNARFLRETRWYCEVCQREYSLGSKINHTNTKKHLIQNLSLIIHLEKHFLMLPSD